MTAGRLEFVGFVDLPAHRRPGGFDYAAVHPRAGRGYVAHTANDALGVIDGLTSRYVGAIPPSPDRSLFLSSTFVRASSPPRFQYTVAPGGRCMTRRRTRSS